MARKYIAPDLVKTPNSHSDSQETHPAFAQIACSRVTCMPGEALYGSDFRHNAYMTITIRRSVLNRGLNRDWAHGHEELIEVALSESQWAAFVSTPNSGLGTQCTMQYYRPEGWIPGIFAPPERTEQFKTEAQERLQLMFATAEKLAATIDGNKALSQKAKDELKSQLDTITRQLTDGVPWVAKQFAEHVEETTDKARAEIHAYMEQTINRAGLRALAEKAGIPELARGPFDMNVLPEGADRGDNDQAGKKDSEV